MTEDQPRIISIGGAVQDVYLMGKVFEPHCEDKTCVEEFALGSKNDIDDIFFSTGGGATNASVTFARQGLHSMYLGKVGHDVAGKAILDALHADQVDTSLVSQSKDYATGFSAILLASNGERTILTYRGASTHYELHEEDFHHTHADWLFLTSVEGNFEVIEMVFEYAREHGCKIAMIPGKKELADANRLKGLLDRLEVFCANKEEMQALFEGDDCEGLAKQASQFSKYVVVTDGPNGVVACDGSSIYRAGMYEDVKVVDRLGAGDAFSSGFVAMIAKGRTVQEAIIFASANSTSVVSQIGAKTGILREGAQLHGMPVEFSAI